MYAILYLSVLGFNGDEQPVLLSIRFPLETQLLGIQSSRYAGKYGGDSKEFGSGNARVVVSGPQTKARP